MSSVASRTKAKKVAKNTKPTVGDVQKETESTRGCLVDRVYSPDAKEFLIQLFENAIEAIKNDDIRSTADFGLFALHLKSVLMMIDGESFEGLDFEDPSPCMPLCHKLQADKTGMNIQWGEIFTEYAGITDHNYDASEFESKLQSVGM